MIRTHLRSFSFLLILITKLSSEAMISLTEEMRGWLRAPQAISLAPAHWGLNCEDCSPLVGLKILM